MIKLNSFTELEIPNDLFPIESGFYLEHIAGKAINFLAGMTLEEVNESLVYVRLTVRQVRQMHAKSGLDEMLGDIVRKNLDDKDRFIPPEKQVGTDTLFTQFLDMSFHSNNSGYLKNNIIDNDKVKEVSESYKKLYGSISLYYYILGIRVAMREKRNNPNNDCRYYRLGKSAPLFFTSTIFLDLLSKMQSELSAITHKESQLKELRKENTSKGGKRKNDYYKLIKMKCIKNYIDNYSDKSNRKASKLIYDELSKPDQLVFKNDDPAHQIALWIGQYKKGTLDI